MDTPISPVAYEVIIVQQLGFSMVSQLTPTQRQTYSASRESI